MCIYIYIIFIHIYIHILCHKESSYQVVALATFVCDQVGLATSYFVCQGREVGCDVQQVLVARDWIVQIHVSSWHDIWGYLHTMNWNNRFDTWKDIVLFGGLNVQCLWCWIDVYTNLTNLMYIVMMAQCEKIIWTHAAGQSSRSFWLECCSVQQLDEIARTIITSRPIWGNTLKGHGT